MTTQTVTNGKAVPDNVMPESPKVHIVANGDKSKPYLPKEGPLADLLVLIDAAHEAGNMPILYGDSGIGKTAFVEELAKRENCAGQVKILLNSMERTDMLGLPERNPVGENVSTTVYCDPHWAWVANQTPPDQYFYVYFDEATTAEIDMQNTMLTLVQSRELSSGTKINDNVRFIAAANPPECVDSVYDLITPLANRLMHLEFSVDNNTWLKGFEEAWGRDLTLREKRLRITVRAFLAQHSDLIQDDGKETTRNGAWPSRRSWDNAVRTAAKLPDDRLVHRVLRSFVGQAAQDQFTAFQEGFKLPEPEVIVADPAGCGVDWSDSTVTLLGLSMLLAWMTDQQTAEQVGAVFEHVASVTPYKDVPTLLFGEFLDQCMRVGAYVEVDPELFGDFRDLVGMSWDGSSF